MQKTLFRYYPYILFLLFLALQNNVAAQGKIPKGFCIKNIEYELFNNINQLRADYGKPKLQLSASLSYVGSMHVNDLQNNSPDTSICNLSSWSDKGDWTPCCYTKYLHNPDCMWDKPKELTTYTYRGYELVTKMQDEFNADSIINLWSDSKEVLDMILTRGKYAKKKWICAGVGVSDNYISLWFGQRKDKLRKPKICKVINERNDTITTIKASTKKVAYYLIFGSFDNMHDAKDALKSTKNDDFQHSGILEKSNKFRVYLNKYGSMKEIMYAKQQLPYSYREAWILKD